MTERADVEIITDRVDVIACNKCGTHLPVVDCEPFAEVECPKCRAHHRVPIRLGHFLLVQLLGKGGMGAVYKALDQTLGRYVALKVMRKELGDNAASLENFLREARAAAALNHVNVVQIYSCGQEKGQPFIVMELVDGGRLDALMAAGQPIDEARLNEIGVHVAQGLGAAHEIGLVHGDVKPANVMFGRDGTAKVVDFGLARFVAAHQAPGEIWGTPFYIAPEKVQKLPEDHRSDIYSLGATLFHALAGRPPFDGETATDVVIARLKGPAPDVREFRSELQPETARVLARMLDVEPGRRYPTYTSLLADLREAARVARTAPPGHYRKEVETGSGKGLIIAGVVALLVLGGLGYGGWRWYKQAQKSKPSATARKPSRHVLVGGKLVAVYDDEAAGAPAAAAAAAPPPAAAAAPAPAIPSQPFSPEQEGILAEVINTWAAGGSTEDADRRLQELYQALPEGSPERAWVRVWQALVALAAGRSDSVSGYLSEVRNASFSGVAEGQKHPGLMARDVARYLAGDLDELSLYTQAAAWPAWYGAFLRFVTGLQAMRHGQIPEAISFFDEYLKPDAAKAADAAWPAAFKPLASKWQEELQVWRELTGQVRRQADAGEYEAALAALADFRARAMPALAASVDRERERVDARRAEAAAQRAGQQVEQQRAEQLARQQALQADLDRVDAAREGLANLYNAREFRRAAQQLARVQPELTTPEGRDYHQVVCDGFERMEKLKDFLIDNLQANPVGAAAAAETGGSVLGANRQGLRVALGGQGELVRPWNQVSTRLFVWMAGHYLANPAIPAADRAEQFLALALFCYEGGGFDVAAKYAEQAAELSPELKPTVRRFLPDILPD
jgi:serine/threonine protein kinase